MKVKHTHHTQFFLQNLSYKFRIILYSFLFIFLFGYTTSYCQKQTLEGIKAGKPLVINQLSYSTLEGFIDVPEDYKNPSSRRIQLPFFVVKSPAQKPAEPILWLDGGPGGSNIISEKKIASTNNTTLLATHDFVCVGYRGVDGSTVLKSKKVNKAMKGLHHQMLSPESLKNIENRIKEYTDELKNEGININNYTIPNVVEDIESVRKLLGYKKINLLSVSYGTRVALLYSYMYPENLNRTIMIGACPPGYFLAKSYQAENVINLYDGVYQSQSNSKNSIREAMQKSFKNLPKRWSIYKLDVNKIKAGTASALYSKGFALLAFNAYFDAANKGDYSGLFLLQKVQDMSSKAIIGDVFAKTVSADMSASTNSTLPERSQDSTILGNNIFTIYQFVSNVWRIESIPKEYTTCKPTDKETLIISGNLDFRTPPSIVDKELMPFLKNGKHIILENMSHTDILSNTMKSQIFLQQYFDEGIVNNELIQKAEPIKFDSKNRLGKAKIFVLGIIM